MVVKWAVAMGLGWVVAVGLGWVSGVLPWVFRYEVVGFTVMVGVAAVRWVVVDNTYTTVYIHTLLLIYATY